MMWLITTSISCNWRVLIFINMTNYFFLLCGNTMTTDNTNMRHDMTCYRPLLIALCKRDFPVLSFRLTSAWCFTKVCATLFCMDWRARSSGISPLLSTSFTLLGNCSAKVHEKQSLVLFLLLFGCQEVITENSLTKNKKKMQA